MGAAGLSLCHKYGDLIKTKEKSRFVSLMSSRMHARVHFTATYENP